jgi:hypothetical protein
VVGAPAVSHWRCRYERGAAAPTAAMNSILRGGHGAAEKADMLQRLWAMFQTLTGIASDQLQSPSSRELRKGSEASDRFDFVLP